ncbi:hypothetical protein E5AUHO_24130 [Citrobacter freundii]|nr:hypothetical protein E5AUHO_24130 [Citrobacter freundii]
MKEGYDFIIRSIDISTEETKTTLSAQYKNHNALNLNEFILCIINNNYGGLLYIKLMNKRMKHIKKHLTDFSQ